MNHPLYLNRTYQSNISIESSKRKSGLRNRTEVWQRLDLAIVALAAAPRKTKERKP